MWTPEFGVDSEVDNANDFVVHMMAEWYEPLVGDARQPHPVATAVGSSHSAGDVAAATSVGVIGVASIVGRFALGAAAARTGVLRTYQACFALMVGSFLLWLGEPGYPRLVVFTVLLGIGYGGFVALGPALVATLFGARGLGGLLGVLYTSAAVGSAIGPPAAGAVIGATGKCTPAVVSALALRALATAMVLTVRTAQPVDSSM